MACTELQCMYKGELYLFTLRDITWHEVVIFTVMRASDLTMSCQITNLESIYTGCTKICFTKILLTFQ